MKRALATLQEVQPGPWASIVWAGPGYGSCLEVVSRLDSGSYFLLEPHPALNTRLARRLRGTSIRIDDRALGVTAGHRDFHLMSDPVRSTLLDIEAVTGERPNLRCLDTIEVDVLTLADLAADQGMNPDQPNLLILDDTGMEAALLGDSGRSAIQAFSHVLAGSSAGPGFSRAAPEGFDEPLEFESDVGQAWRLYVRQRAGVLVGPAECSRAEKLELEAQIDALGGERDDLVRECRELTQQLQQQDADGTHLREQLAAHVARIGEFEATVARQQQHIAELEQAQAAASQAHDEALAEKVREIAGLNNRIGEFETTVAQQQQRLGELDQRLKDAAQSARLATRLQTVREQDLRDLQQRYDEARQVQEHQHALLVRISDRLGNAASYFHALADSRSAAPETVVYEEVDVKQVDVKQARTRKGRKKGAR